MLILLLKLKVTDGVVAGTDCWIERVNQLQEGIKMIAELYYFACLAILQPI
jgi:hypothetical protein